MDLKLSNVGIFRSSAGREFQAVEPMIIIIKSKHLQIDNYVKCVFIAAMCRALNADGEI